MFEQLVARENRFSISYVEGLIHRIKNPNLMVHSKSEVIIANELISADTKFKYEEMPNRDGYQCLPDFTLVDLSNEIIIWGHLGMPTIPEYKTSWEKKLKFYNSIGLIEDESLFTTHGHENGSIDTTETMKVIDKIKNLVEQISGTEITMSGGYFSRHMIAFGGIASSIERDIARTLQPKPGRYIKIIGLFTRKIILVHTIAIRVLLVMKMRSLFF